MSKFFGGAGSDTESSSDSGGKIYRTRTDDKSRRSKGSRYIDEHCQHSINTPSLFLSGSSSDEEVQVQAKKPAKHLTAAAILVCFIITFVERIM